MGITNTRIPAGRAGGGTACGAGGAGGASGASYYNYTSNASGATQVLITDGKISASDVIIDGVSLKENIDTINKRLAILTPDYSKHEKFAALKEAYEQYKLLEALIGDDNLPKA